MFANYVRSRALIRLELLIADVAVVAGDDDDDDTQVTNGSQFSMK